MKKLWGVLKGNKVLVFGLIGILVAVGYSGCAVTTSQAAPVYEYDYYGYSIAEQACSCDGSWYHGAWCGFIDWIDGLFDDGGPKKG